MPYDDLPLRTGSTPGLPPPPPPLPPPASSGARWIVVGAAALAAGAILTFWWMTRAQPDGTLPAPTEASDSARTPNRPQRQPMELPGLDASDTLFRELVGVLSRNPMLARLLATDGLIRAAVLSVDQIGDGRTPALTLSPLRPPTRLAITGTDSGPIDARTYARWTSATGALTSINPGEAAQLYVNLKPLFDAAYADLGHPADFDAGIKKAMNMLIATPEPTGDPVLLRRPGYYEHTEASLRSLRPVQKQLLLLGPESRRQVLSWLRRLADALDLTIAG